MANIKDPYSNGLIITYIEGDEALERIPSQFVDRADDKLHTIRDEDTLRTISQQYYRDGSYWYVIADRNNLDDIFTLITGEDLIIPHINNI